MSLDQTKVDNNNNNNRSNFMILHAHFSSLSFMCVSWGNKRVPGWHRNVH